MNTGHSLSLTVHHGTIRHRRCLLNNKREALARAHTHKHTAHVYVIVLVQVFVISLVSLNDSKERIHKR